MKFIIAIFMALGLWSCATGSGEETAKKAAAETEFAVHFLKTSFSEAQQQAQTTGKPMLVDVYAVWCGPCKKLDKAVFSDAEAGAYLNDNFVCLKVDGEKGEGPEMMEKFGIRGYPTVLVLDAQGNEIDRVVGFGGDKDGFIQTVKDYAAGKNTLNLLIERAQKNPGDVELNVKIARKLQMRSDTQQALEFYKKVLAADPENQKGFTEEAEFQIAVAMLQLNNDDRKIKAFIESEPNDQYFIEAYSRMIKFYERNENLEKALTIYQELVDKFPDNATLLNNFAWYIYDKKAEDHFDQAIAIAQKAVGLEPQADYIWDTLARLQFAKGNIDDAVESMQKAADLNPEETTYQKLLDEYRARLKAKA